MYLCPHCGEPGISAWQKAFITHLSPAECQQCKGKAGIRALHYYLTGLPILLCLLGLIIPAMTAACAWVRRRLRLPLEPRILVTWMFVVYFFVLLGSGAISLSAVVYALRLQCVPLVRPVIQTPRLRAYTRARVVLVQPVEV